jgi:hypothetical protein
VTLASGRISVVCHPEHGFHISHLVDRRSGTNLLWFRGENPPPACPDHPGPAGRASMDTFDRDLLIGGWFVMFLSAGHPGCSTAVRRPGCTATRPRLPWRLVSADGSRAVAEVALVSTPFLVRRSVTVEGPGVTVSTTATNTGDGAVSCTFGEHPCLARAAFAGGRIDGVGVVGPAGDGGVLPAVADGRHTQDPAVLGDAELAVTSPALGGRVVFDVDRAVLPYAMVWQHFGPPGGLRDGDVFAVEPCSYPGSSVTDAVAAGAVTRVEPGASITFGLRLTLDLG